MTTAKRGRANKRGRLLTVRRSLTGNDRWFVDEGRISIALFRDRDDADAFVRAIGKPEKPAPGKE